MICCFVSNKFDTICNIFCNILMNSSYLCLPGIYDLGWQKLWTWHCKRKIYRQIQDGGGCLLLIYMYKEQESKNLVQ